MSERYRALRAESYSSLEKKAESVRRVLGFDLEGKIPGLSLFEALDNYSVGGGDIGLRYAIEELEAGIEAEARYESGERAIVVSLSPRTYEGLEADQPRARFTVFHEIGHAVLHGPLLIQLSRIPRDQVRALARSENLARRSCEDVEWQANAFAAALAMPAKGLERLARSGALTADRVAMEFNMSLAAARNRTKTFEERRFELLR